MIGTPLRRFGWRRPLWLVVLGFGLATYFGYHALTGSRGLLAWRDVNAELASTRQELETLRAERRALAQKVSRLRDDGLDPDLIDELARRQLSLVDPLDVIILLDEGAARR
ncbi:MAG TPA: septum formation initiator family protein [Geminicoccaceae bacterium]|nr:septum formation initiator family protein [Geminicoccaceae bacterium]